MSFSTEVIQGLSAAELMSLGLEFADSDPALEEVTQLIMEAAKEQQKALEKETKKIQKEVEKQMAGVDKVSAKLAVSFSIGVEITDAELEAELAELEEEVTGQEPKDKKLTKEEQEFAELEKELEMLEAQGKL